MYSRVTANVYASNQPFIITHIVQNMSNMG